MPTTYELMNLREQQQHIQNSQNVYAMELVTSMKGYGIQTFLEQLIILLRKNSKNCKSVRINSLASVVLGLLAFDVNFQFIKQFYSTGPRRPLCYNICSFVVDKDSLIDIINSQTVVRLQCPQCNPDSQKMFIKQQQIFY